MAGIEKIKLPLQAKSLTIEAIEPYLSTILEKFNKNVTKIKDLWKVYENQHTIYTKTRRYEDDSDVNNIVSTPYLWEMVNFKTGYEFGNAKEYAQTEQSQTKSIKYLSRYAKDSNEKNIDKNVATYIHALGNAYTFIEPKSVVVDSEYEAPYVLYDKKPDTCAKIYSSYNGEEPLFDILVTELEEIEKNFAKTKTLVSIYLPNNYYEYKFDTSTVQWTRTKSEPRTVYKMLPLTEKFANESRIGIVEVGQSLQDAIDTLNSNQLDNVEDLVNQLLVFKNVVLGKDAQEEAATLKTAKKNGALCLFDKNPEIESDVKTIDNKLDYNGIMSVIENLKRDLFDSCGVPIPSSNTANAKAGAVEKGSGYDNAYNRALDDYNSFEKSDRELLKKKLFICKSFVNSKVDDLYASEIEIKYNPNMTDNMLTKSQSYVNFVEHGVPPELAIAWCRISNDAITPANQIRAYALELEKKEQEKAERELKPQQKNVPRGTTNNDIGSGNTENING